jgi:hypothetical protein
MRRLAYFYTRAVIDDRALALVQAYQHPDYEHLSTG